MVPVSCPCPEGDVADSAAATRAALELLVGRFRRVVWVPGNHELWVKPGTSEAAQYPDAFAKLMALRQVGGAGGAGRVNAGSRNGSTCDGAAATSHRCGPDLARNTRRLFWADRNRLRGEVATADHLHVSMAIIIKLEACPSMVLVGGAADGTGGGGGPGPSGLWPPGAGGAAAVLVQPRL